jgi:hypothetical protein
MRLGKHGKAHGPAEKISAMTHAATWRIALTLVVACLLLNVACANTPEPAADHLGQENMSPEELEAELKKVQEEVRILRVFVRQIVVPLQSI